MLNFDDNIPSVNQFGPMNLHSTEKDMPQAMIVDSQQGCNKEVVVETKIYQQLYTTLSVGVSCRSTDMHNKQKYAENK